MNLLTALKELLNCFSMHTNKWLEGKEILSQISFHYPHLHRYSIERYVSGIEPVVPLDPSEFRKSLGPAYRKGWYLPKGLGERKANCKVGRSNMNIISTLYKKVKQKIKRKQSTEDFYKYLETKYHADGHMIVARACSTKRDELSQMAYSEVSARDPIFYRWHKHLEVVAQEYRNKRLPK